MRILHLNVFPLFTYVCWAVARNTEAPGQIVIVRPPLLLPRTYMYIRPCYYWGF